MPAYVTGQRYPTDHPLRLEGARYTYRDDGHELAVFLRAVTDRQVGDLHGESMELALVIDEGEIVFCGRFGVSIPWSRAAPYRWREVPRTRRRMPPAPEVTPGLHVLLTVVLVEADDGRVRAQRGVFLSPAFTTALHAAIRGQTSSPGETARRPGLGHAPEPPPARLHRLYREPSECIPKGLTRGSFAADMR